MKDKNVTFSHVCEVGVYLPETSNVLDFIEAGIRATLVEADPETVVKIKEFFKDKDITLHPYAVWETGGTIRLSRAKASTFVSELGSSPAIENDNFKVEDNDSFETESRNFADLDDGTIDLISIDIEGCEWYVIKNMTSRPKIVSVETHGKYYTNPFIGEISAWMTDNGYALWYKDGSDSVFVRNDVFVPSAADRISLRLRDIRISLKKARRVFKRNP